ncbi:GNAT family N-acetyltransferase [Natrarchaeobaculum aegyptiacum]|uniref:GNAT family N-acetyltransferase n=2 Tax=Natrarchaeobaculum aegyptiacum TaxID=745377 RepID=A0A2Z2HRZ1_9EURY|nr:GNAT family N-acetyltransferase [Natrarchaeobaculum aegyptiacum]
MGTGTDSSVACTWDNGSCEGTPLCPPRCPRFTDREGHPMLVRPSEPADFDALVEMYEDLDGHSRAMGLPPATTPKLEAWLSRLLDTGWNLIALDGDRVVGHVAVIPAESADPEFVIFVHQDYQNRGVGSELVKQLIAHAGDRAHDELTLSVSSGNRRAITVYQNVGFDVVERQVTELAMALDLQQPIVEQVQQPPAARN